MEQQPPKESPKPQQSSNSFFKLAVMAFQMLAVILIGTWGGMRLDEWLYNEFPVFTIGLIFLSVIISIYQAAQHFLSDS